MAERCRRKKLTDAEEMLPRGSGRSLNNEKEI
jgi:hypothetical protein